MQATPTTTSSGSQNEGVSPAPAVFPFPLTGVNPGPRCGHTLTTVLGPNGDVGSAKLVLFGGATALEWPGKGAKPSGPPTPAPSSSGIRLAGATQDVHIFDVRSGKWEKVVPQGDAPSPTRGACGGGGRQHGCDPGRDWSKWTVS